MLLLFFAYYWADAVHAALMISVLDFKDICLFFYAKYVNDNPAVFMHSGAFYAFVCFYAYKYSM